LKERDHSASICIVLLWTGEGSKAAESDNKLNVRKRERKWEKIERVAFSETFG